MRNSPLREIIAELRWGEGDPRAATGILLGGDETIYVRFGIEIGKLGFTQLERTVPQGFPIAGGSVQYRYRKSGEEQNTLYQLGPGVFTTNGLPPYSSWTNFEPVVAAGLEALWAVGGPFQQGPVWLILRYVDGFDATHLAGVTAGEFYEQVVGIRFNKPPAWGEFAGQEGQDQIKLFVSRQNAAGQELQLEVGEGKVAGTDAQIMNTVLISQPLEQASVADITRCFGELQQWAHRVFMEMIDRNAVVSRNLRGE